MKKKILFFHFDLKGGGAEKVLVNLVNNLDQNKYDITVQTLFGVGTHIKELNKDIHFKYLFKKQFRGLPKFLKLFNPALIHKLIIKEKYDLEIAYLETAPTRIISGCKDNNTKKIAWVHSILSKRPKTYRSIQEMAICYRNFDKIVCVSKSVLESFDKLLQEKFPTCVVRNLVDYNHIIYLSKENVSFPEDGKLKIIFIGKLIKSKGAFRLLKILHELFLAGLNNWHLYYLGIGDQQQIIEESIMKWGMQKIVTLLGYQDNPYKFISKMDLYVCASYSEGYSTAATEATILGIPTITTRCGGMDEIFNKGEYGMIVENDDTSLKDGIIQLLNNPQLMFFYKSQASIRKKIFDSKIILKENEAIFDSLLNE